ncbi:unnamed protein product, partial [Ectocarpus sp. 8 AP-2014]
GENGTPATTHPSITLSIFEHHQLLCTAVVPGNFLALRTTIDCRDSACTSSLRNQSYSALQQPSIVLFARVAVCIRTSCSISSTSRCPLLIRASNKVILVQQTRIDNFLLPSDDTRSGLQLILHTEGATT